MSKIPEAALTEFQKVFQGKILFEEPMSEHTSWKIGGAAEYFLIPETVNDIAEALRFTHLHQVPLTIIGRGTNLLVSDAGIEGMVLQIADQFQKILWLNKTEVRAEAGCLLAALSRDAARNGCTGLEWACGIPGNVGGAIMMNAGAYGSHISHYVTEIEMIVLSSEGKPQLKVCTKGDLDFSYRHSGIGPDQVVVGVNFLLEPGDRAASEAQMRELLQTRAAKQPLEYPSAGSVFKNPDGNHAGRLVEVCGCRGLTCGGAQVSEKHGNFIINRGGATAADVLSLIQQVREIVRNQTGILLEPEVRKIGRFPQG